MHNLTRQIPLLALAFLLLVPAAASAASSREKKDTSLWGYVRSQVVGVKEKQPNPRAVLRQEQHAKRMVKVQGITRGMTKKMENLSRRLDKQLANAEQRIERLQAAGHVLTVDSELNALRETVEGTQNDIDEIIVTLESIVESEQPEQSVAQIRAMIRTLNDKLKGVREAFHTLQQAVSSDLSLKESE